MPYDPHKVSNLKPSIAAALTEGGPAFGEVAYGQGGFGGQNKPGSPIGAEQRQMLVQPPYKPAGPGVDNLGGQSPPTLPDEGHPLQTPQQRQNMEELHRIVAQRQAQGEPTTFTGQQQALGDNPTGPRDEAVMKAAEDAMLYGEGYVRMQGEDRMPGGMGNDIRSPTEMELLRRPPITSDLKQFETTATHYPASDVRSASPPPPPPPTSLEFFDFGVAIRSMECGLRVQRAGWNGKDMWIAISGLEGAREVQSGDLWSYQAKKHARDNGGAATVLPCIIMKTATGEILMGWLASQSDMLAKDWRIVD